MNLRLKELTEELDKCKEVKDNVAKYYQKDTNEMQARYQKEFELISIAIYNLGFTFWSMKYEYEQKLIKNPNWLITERQKSSMEIIRLNNYLINIFIIKYVIIF